MIEANEINGNFRIGSRHRFIDDPHVWETKAIGPRYAIMTRPIFDDDEDFEEHGGSGYYTIVDSKTWKRGPHDRVFNMWDMKDQQQIEKCLAEIEAGHIELSRRNSIECRFDGEICE